MTNFETSNVMQTVEDAFVREIKEVFPSEYPIYTNPLKQKIPKKAIVLVLQTMNMQRSPLSDATKRWTIMFDLAVVTDEPSYWIENRLMEINSIKFGEIKKVFTSGRFSRVEGVTHLSGYFYITEAINIEASLNETK
ncbi:hypothetical protein [Bacillus anthracis]|uniref:hypothetical protein n=2 Tax=Bacillus cereus group TaxID=86661 RepID=UPI001D2F360B|nr:hypothetical protein [Bacillus cereus]